MVDTAHHGRPALESWAERGSEMPVSKMAFLGLLSTEPSGISVLPFPHTVLISVQTKLGLFCDLSFFPTLIRIKTINY